MRHEVVSREKEWEVTMTKHGITVIATAMAMAVAATASAEVKGQRSADGEAPAEEEMPVSPPAAEVPAFTPDSGITPVPNPKPTRWQPASGVGMAVMGGGGVTNFTGNTASDATDVGGSWDIRFAIATRRWVGFEASYIGGTNSFNNALGLNTENTTRLNRNGIEAALRLNAPLYAKNVLLSPYLLGGLGWNSYRVSNFNTATADVSIATGNDNTMSVPVATGFAVGYKGFIADARFTFRPTFYQHTFATASSTGLTNWDAGAMVGYEF